MIANASILLCPSKRCASVIATRAMHTGGLAELPGLGVELNVSFAPIYRVILHYTHWNDNIMVAKKVARAVPLLNKSSALRIVENAVASGTAVVVTVPVDDAKTYETRLIRSGLMSTIEAA